MQKIQFRPLNDQVLVKMDMQKKSRLEIDSTRPTVLPSGVVVAVGRGTFQPGIGFTEPQVKVGDHVAVSLDGPYAVVPLADKEASEVYIVLSESMVLGLLQGADENSCWFKAADEAQGAANRVISAIRR